MGKECPFFKSATLVVNRNLNISPLHFEINKDSRNKRDRHFQDDKKGRLFFYRRKGLPPCHPVRNFVFLEVVSG